MNLQTKDKGCIKYYVILVALKRGRFRHYIAHPEIFFTTQEQAKQVKQELIDKKKYTSSQLKIQIVWKVN